MQRALQGLSSQPDFVLVDARKIPNCLVHSAELSGAMLFRQHRSRIDHRKDQRDAHMLELDSLYSDMGWHLTKDTRL